MSAEIAISVRSISKHYNDFKSHKDRLLSLFFSSKSEGAGKISALSDISFDIEKGDAVALIGKNGGGKSTLLQIITGTLAATSGEVVVSGRVSALLELGSGFNPEYTGRENVILNGLLLGLSKEEIAARFSEIEEFAEIGTAVDRPVKTYSSGMVLRLAFAVQVLCDPDILIIDEALSVGDIFCQQKCLSYIRKLRERGVTLLFVSHDMASVREICNKAVYLKAGNLEYFGDKILAIRKYLEDANYADYESSPVLSQKYSDAFIDSIEVVDEFGNDCSTIEMGSEAIFLITYKVNQAYPVHVTVSLKNRYGSIVTAVGTHNLCISPPISENVPACFVAKMNFECSMESGDYTYCVSLTRAIDSTHAGEMVAETGWLGPLKIYWDYTEKTPPFYGLFGTKVEAKISALDKNSHS